MLLSSYLLHTRCFSEKHFYGPLGLCAHSSHPKESVVTDSRSRRSRIENVDKEALKTELGSGIHLIGWHYVQPVSVRRVSPVRYDVLESHQSPNVQDFNGGPNGVRCLDLPRQALTPMLLQHAARVRRQNAHPPHNDGVLKARWAHTTQH